MPLNPTPGRPKSTFSRSQALKTAILSSPRLSQALKTPLSPVPDHPEIRSPKLFWKKGSSCFFSSSGFSKKVLKLPRPKFRLPQLASNSLQGSSKTISTRSQALKTAILSSPRPPRPDLKRSKHPFTHSQTIPKIALQNPDSQTFFPNPLPRKKNKRPPSPKKF